MRYKKSSKPRLIISSYDNIRNIYYKGGGARILDELAQRLSSSFHITIVTARHRDAADFRNGKVKYRHIGPAFAGPRLGQLFFHFLLPYHVRRNNFDVWIESFTPPFSTTCLQMFTKKPVIGLAHMLASEDMWRKYRIPFHILENLGLKTYRFFITLTPNEHRKIRDKNRLAAIFTIPNGIAASTTRSAPKVRNLNKYILYIGRIEYDQKGLDLLIHSYRSIADKTNAKLIIAGSGKKRELRLLRAAIKQSGIADRIELAGEVDGARKDELFRGCIAVIQPSRYETFSVVALEALMYGKPLLSFDIDGLRWLPNECIIRAPAFDTERMGKNILRIIRNRHTRRKLSYAGRRYAKEFSWPFVTRRYHSAIRHAMRMA